MSGRRWAPIVPALIATIILIGACGSSGSDNTGGSGSGSGTGSSHSLVVAQKGVKFAECMRSHGISQFPDPRATGRLTIDAVANGSSVDTSTPAFTHALDACKALEPAGFTGGRRTAQQQSAALKFAACIRQNGVTDFPDPVNGLPLVDTNRIPSTEQPGGMTVLKAAMHKCSALGAAAMRARG
jgi:hypothetical protein